MEGDAYKQGFTDIRIHCKLDMIWRTLEKEFPPLRTGGDDSPPRIWHARAFQGLIRSRGYAVGKEPERYGPDVPSVARKYRSIPQLDGAPEEKPKKQKIDLRLWKFRLNLKNDSQAKHTFAVKHAVVGPTIVKKKHLNIPDLRMARVQEKILILPPSNASETISILKMPIALCEHD